MRSFIRNTTQAKRWNEGNPLGNGRLGVMENGGANKSTIVLNDDTFWSGYGRWKGANAGDAIIRAKNAMLLEDYSLAESIVQNEITGDYTESYLPIGTLILKKGLGVVKEYERVLDLDNATLQVNYKKGKTIYKEESFISYPHDVYVKRITVDKASNVEILMTSAVRYSTCIDGNAIFMSGLAPSKVAPNYVYYDKNPIVYDANNEGMRFDAVLQVETDGEVLNKNDKSILIKGYTSLVIYYSSLTSYKESGDRKSILQEKLASAIRIGYNGCLKAHIEDYKALYDRVELELNGEPDSPVDMRKELRAVEKGANPSGGLIVTLYNFGRYLTIASSREGSEATTLQGIWVNELRSPWSSNYTVNINTQMNYWATETIALPECTEPLIRLIKELAKSGERTAKETFGVERGWAIGHNSDLWRTTNPVGRVKAGSSASYSLCMGASGWFCRHLYERFLHSGDVEFLRKEALPIMRSSAEFYLEYMVEDSEGYLVCTPDISPENSYYKRGKRYSIDLAPTMTMSIIRELFANILSAESYLGVESELGKKIMLALPRLYPIGVGKNGQIKEWHDDYEEVELAHRHVSNLYGLYPGSEITPETTPILATASERSLERRTNEGTGWSLAWKVNMWARLKNGTRAYDILKKQLRLCHQGGHRGGGSYASLLCAHPPFQIDGNFGIVAGINEMLMQSHNDIELLPAIPAEWHSGRVKGLIARGNKRVSITWKNGEIIDKKIEEL